MDRTWQMGVAASGPRLRGGARLRSVVIAVAVLALVVAWELLGAHLLLRTNGHEATTDFIPHGRPHAVATHTAGHTWVVRYDDTTAVPRCTVDGRALRPTSSIRSVWDGGGGDYVALGTFTTTGAAALVRCSGQGEVTVGPAPVRGTALRIAGLLAAPVLGILVAGFATRRRRQPASGSEPALSASNAA